MHRTRSYGWTVCLCLALLVACGGGGSGGGATDPPPGNPIDPDAPSFQFTASFAPATAAVMMGDVLEQGARVISYARFATEIVQRFSVAGGPLTVTTDCTYSGRITLQLIDRDNDGRASAGDRINAVLEDCGVPTLDRFATGSLGIDIVAASLGFEGTLQARLSIDDGLALTGLVGGGNQSTVVAGTLRGSLALEWMQSAVGTQLKVRSTAEDDLRYAIPNGGFVFTETLRRIDVSHALRFYEAINLASLSFLLTRTDGARLLVRTPQALEGDLLAPPRQMRVEAEGARGWMLRMEFGEDSGFTPSYFARIVDPAGRVAGQSDFFPSWDRMLPLLEDPRDPHPVSRTVGGRVLAFHLPTESGPGQDPLFRRPAGTQVALTSPGAVAGLQFARPIAESTPTLQFRFIEPFGRTESGTEPWPVATTVVRRGAYFEIRPVEPLRRGRSYELQTSIDGNHWARDIEVRDPQGRIIHTGWLRWNVQSDNLLVVNTERSDLGVVSGAAPAHLRSDVALNVGQSVRSYRWQQLSGVPLALGTPDAAHTTAAPAAGSPVAVGRAVVQLTVTDTLGHTDHARVTLTVGDHSPQGAALYGQRGDDDGVASRFMVAGVAAFIEDPHSSLLALGVRDPATNRLMGTVSIRPAGGGRLVEGTYGDATPDASASDRNVLLSFLMCEPWDSPRGGSFVVLDVAYDADGTITRLAVDFEDRCQTGQHNYHRGSYRFNSVVPLRP